MRESRPGIAGSVVHFHHDWLILLITITEIGRLPPFSLLIFHSKAEQV
jgi:hypothetical protein